MRKSPSAPTPIPNQTCRPHPRSATPPLSFFPVVFAEELPRFDVVDEFWLISFSWNSFWLTGRICRNPCWQSRSGGRLASEEPRCCSSQATSCIVCVSHLRSSIRAQSLLFRSNFPPDSSFECPEHGILKENSHSIRKRFECVEHGLDFENYNCNL